MDTTYSPDSVAVADTPNVRPTCPVQSAAPKPIILVADDEPAVLAMLSAGLRACGFAVLAAAGGREAVEVYQRHGGAIAAVLVDKRMPGLDGPETLAALRQLNPAVRCCLI